MAKIGGFDPSLGIAPVADGYYEIGHENLPGMARLIPESESGEIRLGVFGRFAESTLLEGFANYLRPEIHHRELLAPDVFFTVLEDAAQQFAQESEKNDPPGEGPLAATARLLQQILADRNLCEMLRKLVVRA